MGSKGKEAKVVPAQQNREFFPLNAHKVRKVSSGMRNICICRSFCFPSDLNQCSQILSSELAVLPVQINNHRWFETKLLQVSLSTVFKNCSHPLNACLGIWSILEGFQVIFALVWLFQIPEQEQSDCNKIGSQQGYWLGDRQPAQTTCPFVFLNSVPWAALFSWNQGYLVHVVSQSLCQCLVIQFLEPRSFSAVRL